MESTVKQVKPENGTGKEHFGVRLPRLLKREVKKTAIVRDLTVEQFVEIALRREIERKR